MVRAAGPQEVGADICRGPRRSEDLEMMISPQYEVRDCWRCSDGRIYGAVGPTEEPRLASCPTCGGKGRVCVYLYPKPGRGRS